MLHKYAVTREIILFYSIIENVQRRCVQQRAPFIHLRFNLCRLILFCIFYLVLYFFYDPIF